MFSRILATESPTVPSTHSGGRAEPRSTAREASSSLRCTSTTLRMYAASSAPRVSMTDCRIASRRRPMSSMSASDRCAVGLTGCLVMTVMRVSFSEGVDAAGAGSGADTGLDRDAVGPGLAGGRDGELAVAQVAHGALAERDDAAE